MREAVSVRGSKAESVVHRKSWAESCRRQVHQQLASTARLTIRRQAMFFGVFWLAKFAVALPEHPETGSTTDPCPVNNETYQIVCQASTTDTGSVDKAHKRRHG